MDADYPSKGVLFPRRNTACSYDEIDDTAARLQPQWLISILGPKERLPWPDVVPAERRLRLAFEDTVVMAGGPQPEHVRDLIAFLRLWNRDGPLLIHYRGGISRSTAAALIALALFHPGREAWAASLLRARGPHARPSAPMIAFADQQLRLDGRLVAAVATMSPPDWSRCDVITLPKEAEE